MISSRNRYVVVVERCERTLANKKQSVQNSVYTLFYYTDLKEEVDDGHGEDDGEEDWSAVADDEDDGNERDGEVEETAHHEWDLNVKRVDIFRAPVHDATERRGVEERHGNAQDTPDETGVHDTSCVCCRVRQSDGAGNNRQNYINKMNFISMFSIIIRYVFNGTYVLHM